MSRTHLAAKKEDSHIRLNRPCDYLKNPVLLLILVLLWSIGFRLYKAHYTGIISDEAWTYGDFCKDIHTAVTVYNTTNNHLLNSIFIVLTKKVAGNYEHFIRIPAVLFGVLFCCMLTYILHKTIHSRPLKVVVLALILMNWFIVDLTYLARGYAIALGAVYTGIAVLVRLSPKSNECRKGNWRLVLLLIAMNFTAFGAMLSSLSVLVCVNAAFMVMMLLSAVKIDRKAVVNTIVRLSFMVLGSIASLLLLYRHVISNVLKYSEVFSVEPLGQYLKKVLWRPLIYDDFTRVKSIEPVYNAALALLVLCAIICICVFIFRLAAGKKERASFFAGPAAIVLMLTAGLLSAMFIQSVVLKMSLGMPRNSVFLLPLTLLSAGILMDKAGKALSHIKPLFVLQQTACIGVLAVLCYMNLPSPRSVVVRAYDWGKQSAVGPLVRMLRDIDPEHTWRIKLIDPDTDCLSRSIYYYKSFGFKVNQVNTDDYDVLVCLQHQLDSRVIYFHNRRFADHHCCVIVNPASFLLF